jgi:hypothetical protein
MAEVVPASSGRLGGSRIVERVVAHYARGLTSTLHRRMERLEAELAATKDDNERLRTELVFLRSEHHAVANRIGHLETALSDPVS